MTWQNKLNKARLEKGSGWYGCVAPDGWKNIILEADEMFARIDPDYRILQIKEKFGTLRYYFGSTKEGVDRNIMGAIESWVMSRSSHTCQDCGKYGQLRTQFYYVLTLCDTCAVERGYDLAWEEQEETD